MTNVPHPFILIVGAADTGRAPMTAALLMRLLARTERPWRVESAGVVGHDGESAESEARYAMAARNLDIGGHRARSLDAALVAEATVLLAVERGIARVLRERYPQALAQVAVLGELAGTQRDIPDPFRMQTGAWMTYAQEIEALLNAALPTLIAMVEGKDDESTSEAVQLVVTEEPARPLSKLVGDMFASAIRPLPDRNEALTRSVRVLTALADFPGVLDWPAARRQIEADLSFVATAPLVEGDLVQAYIAVLNALLALTIQAPAAARYGQLQAAIERLQQPIDQLALAELSALVPVWATSESDLEGRSGRLRPIATPTAHDDVLALLHSDSGLRL
ncbi:hypothetical protein HC891_06825 [Candidatus Gracilibacteria bacterium]|nr:hypothetical protein [Candidatus Gracilibacteria bacterium]